MGCFIASPNPNQRTIVAARRERTGGVGGSSSGRGGRVRVCFGVGAVGTRVVPGWGAVCGGLGSRMGQLLFKKCFWEPIRAGTKRTTLRRWTTPRVKPGGRAFAPGVGWLRVGRVEPVELNALSDRDARSDGFGSLAEMLTALAALYPDHATDGKRWFRVEFSREEDEARPGPAREVRNART